MTAFAQSDDDFFSGSDEALFGSDDDMFGDESEYYQCNFEGSSTVELEPGGMYEISSGGEGTGIGTRSTDRGSI